jgi:thymidine phosphorylase
VARKLGDRVERGEPLCTVHAGPRSEARAAIVARLQRAWSIGPSAPAARPLVLERLA